MKALALPLRMRSTTWKSEEQESPRSPHIMSIGSNCRKHQRDLAGQCAGSHTTLLSWGKRRHQTQWNKAQGPLLQQAWPRLLACGTWRPENLANEQQNASSKTTEPSGFKGDPGPPALPASAVHFQDKIQGLLSSM